MDLIELVRLLENLQPYRFSLVKEEETKAQMKEAFLSMGHHFEAEVVLDAHNRIDFFADGIGIEVKIKGSRKDFYRQCERYCAFPQVKMLVLATNRALALPATINGKRVFVFNFGKAWL